jgi:hypothetical protein
MFIALKMILNISVLSIFERRLYIYSFIYLFITLIQILKTNRQINGAKVKRFRCILIFIKCSRPAYVELEGNC